MPSTRSLRVACLVLALGLARTAAAVTIDAFAAMGASETQGGATQYTGTWVPYFTIDRGLSFGGAGNPHNVAVGGATSATLLSASQRQHTRTRDYVLAGEVDLAFLTIGGNDFGAAAETILTGTPAQVSAWASGVVNNILTAVDTVLNAHPTGMVVNSIPAMTLTPLGRAATGGDADLIARGDAAVAAINTLLKPAILGRGIVFVDLEQAMRDLDAQGLVVGGVTIDMVNASSDPRNFFQDALHPAAVGNGFFANLMLTAVNKGYGTNYSLLSDLEILTRAGLAGSYTGATSAIDYAQYVHVNAVPEPASLVLAMVAAACLVATRACRAARVGAPPYNVGPMVQGTNSS